MALVLQNGSLVAHGNSLGSGPECCCPPSDPVCLPCEEYEEEIEVVVEIYDLYPFGFGPTLTCDQLTPTTINMVLANVGGGAFWQAATGDQYGDVIVTVGIGFTGQECSMYIKVDYTQGPPSFYYPPATWPRELNFWHERLCTNEVPQGLPQEVDWSLDAVSDGVGGIYHPLKKNFSPYCRPPAGEYVTTAVTPLFEDLCEYPACVFRVTIL